MKPKMIVKLTTDVLMTVALLLLMTYELIGQAVHEWVGMVMFVLFIVHHVLNSHWSRGLLKGKYTAARVLQTVLAVSVLLSMIGSMFSGVILSRHVFSFISIRGWRFFARNLHMISAYWRFVFFDYEEPLIFFIMDYVAVMGLFVFLEHYLAELMRRRRLPRIERGVKPIV